MGRRRKPQAVSRTSIKRIVHATDFSASSRRALDLAEELAQALKAELVLCHVYERVVPVGGGMPPTTVPPQVIQDLWERTRKKAIRRLEALATSVRRGPLRVSVRPVNGMPARAIVRLAKETHADLLVLGTQGRTGVKRLVVGSVAERVVRTAHCPVLTVGPRRR